MAKSEAPDRPYRMVKQVKSGRAETIFGRGKTRRGKRLLSSGVTFIVATSTTLVRMTAMMALISKGFKVTKQDEGGGIVHGYAADYQLWRFTSNGVKKAVIDADAAG